MTLSAMPPLAQHVTRTTFEWGRIQSNADWIAPVAVGVALMVFAWLMYQRDARDLPRPLGWLLTALRTVAVFLILVLYLQPQWRNEQERRVNSRAVLLVDTSLSMGLSDEASGAASRADQVVSALEQSNLLDDLRRRHDLAVFRFGETLERVAAFPKREEDSPDVGVEEDASSTGTAAPEKLDLAAALKPTAAQTRLGEALRGVLRQERGAPLAGVILLTDGGQNAGPPPESAVDDAREANVPLLVVGIGSDEKPSNVRVSDFVAPTRAYPGDQYSVTGYLQAQGMAGQVVAVKLLARGEDDKNAAAGTLVESRQVALGADGEVLPVPFVLSPEATGRQTLVFQVEPPASDRLARDNRREVDVEIVDRKNRVLLLAGGPMREYQFLRNLLHRDGSTTVDVLLQTARPGISQDASAVLDAFPATREEMFAYDCVVAFDPDWQALGTAQIDLLESWVAEQGGGLIALAGPVNMGNPIRGWIQDDQMAKVRALYPVTFQRRFAMDTTSYSSKDPWPLDFTREGREAPFLWLTDDAVTSHERWNDFPGVYGCYPVRGAKPGATVHARFSDPRAAAGGEPPVYLAGQFYGSGRVFYMGSAEMWRLRACDESWFEVFYTKLIRHVSEGRLLRGSSRGVLLTAQDRYVLGATVEVRAQLTNARLEPLEAAGVSMQVVAPDGSIQTVALRPDGSRPGTFAGQFTASAEGAYRLELPVPESDDERLTRRIQANVPDLERDHPQRNDALLGKLAADTRGRYYVGLAAALGPNAAAPLVEQLPDRAKTIITPVAPDDRRRERWLGWMMLGLCGLLFAEWLIRRLVRLA
ncbi:MAG: VWA domain-containing protein [Pirellulales bacterium]|nr:VWA domain-containing protein [Pirellulales bacterium]